MKKILGWRFFCLLFVLSFILPPFMTGGRSFYAKEEPVLTVACVSDIHTDYGLQLSVPYMRGSTKRALDRIAAEEDADVLLVGGDTVSDNANQSQKSVWRKQNYDKLVKSFKETAQSIAPYSLWACGNHDYQAGEDFNYDSYAGFEQIMDEMCREGRLSVYRQKDDRGITDKTYPEFLLGAHYKVKGFDFIVLNSPYGKDETYTSGTLGWLSQRLSSIGKDKTVFLLTHYPLDGIKNVSPDYVIKEESSRRLKSILMGYPNLIYLHGHDHGYGRDKYSNLGSAYISTDTFERITSFTSSGSAVSNRNTPPTSFITSFMGSMGYAYIDLFPGPLEDRDANVVQALMIYVYSDRIEFQMKNYGTARKNSLSAWTVSRDVKSTLEDPDLEEDSKDTQTNSTDSFGPSGTSYPGPSVTDTSSGRPDTDTGTDSYIGNTSSPSSSATDTSVTDPFDPDAPATDVSDTDFQASGSLVADSSMTDSSVTEIGSLSDTETKDSEHTDAVGAESGRSDSGDPVQTETTGIVLACVGGGIGFGGIGTLTGILIRLRKKDGI